MLKTLTKVFALLLFVPVSLQAQELETNLDSLFNMSAYTEESELQKKLNQNLTVSSSKALTTRETPGIISLITAEEIQNSGARDLMDVLRLVPGFEVGQDLQFVMGIGLRGNWANEGKVLVMLDGQQFNELLYQGVAIGNRFPVDNIERIEIIRGPGSAIYGGSAEYGVINIVSKAADKLNGLHVFGTGGFHADATGRTNAGVSIAQKLNNVAWDISFFKGKGIVSDLPYESLYGDTTVANLSTATTADPMNINVGLRIKGFQLRTMYDEYQTSEPFTFISFKNYFLDLKYDIKVSNQLTLTPQFKYANQVPWQFGYMDAFEEDGVFYEAGEDYLKVRAERTSASLSASYDITRKFNINFGGLYFKDKATDLLDGGYFFGGNEIAFNNFAVYAQGLFKHRLFNATLGFRYEKNNQYGDAFVPRMALTKKIENFHFKVLYSQAFRAPGIENINLAEGGEGAIKPEKSNVFEFELGYQFTPEMLLAVNAYNLKTKNTIVYGVDSVAAGFYKNYPESGTKGVELVYSIRKKNWYGNLTYSFSKAESGDTAVHVLTYIVPQSNSQYAGFPTHKVTLNSNFNITPKLTFNTSLIYGSTRYAYNTYTTDADEDGVEDVDEDGEMIQTPIASDIGDYVLVNTFLNYKDLIPGLTAGFGVFDLFNESPVIPQMYNGDYAPIPGRSREYVIKLSYQLNFKK